MMAKIANRRTLSRKSPKSFWPSRVSRLRCNTSGTTMSLDTMIGSATHSRITIGVARDRERVEGAQIDGKQPAGAVALGHAGTLDHADVKLSRQQHDRAERQQRH